VEVSDEWLLYCRRSLWTEKENYWIQYL
jgi:hypothetical protein